MILEYFIGNLITGAIATPIALYLYKTKQTITKRGRESNHKSGFRGQCICGYKTIIKPDDENPSRARWVNEPFVFAGHTPNGFNLMCPKCKRIQEKKVILLDNPYVYKNSK